MGLLGSFLGKDQQRDIINANNQATAALKTGYDSAYGDYTGAIDSYSPYAQQGQKANTFYGNLLGLNGADARAQSQGILTSDPLFQGQLAQDSNAILRNLNARGASGGGEAQLAAQRVLQQNYGSWMDRYNQAGQQGFQATNAMAGAQQARGDLSYGYGATKAGQAINFGNAMASNRNTGVNNILKLAGTAAKAAAAFA